MTRMGRSRLKIRRIIQLASAVLLNGYTVGFAKGEIYTGTSKSICVPVLNCYSCPGAIGACPIGALQQAVGGVNHHFPFYVLGTLMLFGVLLGRAVCGLLCPFGFIQDLLHKLARFMPRRLRHLRLPRRLDRVLRALKYVMLVGVVIALPLIVAAYQGYAPPFFCEFICPAGTLEAGIPLLIADDNLRKLIGALFNWKLAVLVAIIVFAVIIPRPFCKYLCPLGAFYSLFNRFSAAQIRRELALCTQCHHCEEACPMGVSVEGISISPECIKCGECVHACPTQALKWRIIHDSTDPTHGSDTQMPFFLTCRFWRKGAAKKSNL